MSHTTYTKPGETHATQPLWSSPLTSLNNPLTLSHQLLAITLAIFNN